MKVSPWRHLKAGTRLSPSTSWPQTPRPFQLNLLGWNWGGPRCLLSCLFLNEQLKIDTPKGRFRVAKLWPLQQSHPFQGIKFHRHTDALCISLCKLTHPSELQISINHRPLGHRHLSHLSHSAGVKPDLGLMGTSLTQSTAP